MTTTMRVAMVIRSLNRGGAERQFITVAQGLAARGHRVEVTTLYSGGALDHEFDDASAPLRSLEKSGRFHLLAPARRLRAQLQAFNPQVVYSFLPEANVAVALLRPVLPRAAIVWGIRSAVMPAERLTRFDKGLLAVARRLSRRPDAILANSHAGRAAHIAAGYAPGRWQVVGNGIDTSRFRPDAAAGHAWRRRFGISEDRLLVGYPGRIDPVKDHHVFLSAMAQVATAEPRAAFVCVGGGDPSLVTALQDRAGALGLQEKLVWTGEERDMNAVYNGLDLSVSASASEGFPNSIGEALAAATPVVVTDAGDSAQIVGDTGAVVPVGDPGSLADACLKALPTARARNAPGRARIEALFSVGRMLEGTEDVLRAAVRRAGRDVSFSPTNR